MKEKNFSFLSTKNDCTSDVAERESFCRKVHTYNIRQYESDLKITVEFGFIDLCGAEFGGDFIQNADSLNLKYYSFSMPVADCYCCYQYNFILPKPKNKINVITLNGQPLSYYKKHDELFTQKIVKMKLKRLIKTPLLNDFSYLNSFGFTSETR